MGNGAAKGVRRAFLDERRRMCERRMDTLHAPSYDTRWGSYVNQAHRHCVETLLSKVGPGATLLDAGCGTGKYWPTLLACGSRVIGVDQSRAMLARASEKHPDVSVAHGSLQALGELIDQEVDGLLCIDAMENVGPEDWPRVLQQFSAVLRSGGSAYLTVEIADEEVVMDDEADSAPLVPGEVLVDGAYHFYPDRKRVRDWLETHDLEVWGESVGDGYRHFLAERR